jgi:hypothetical protein
MHSDESMSGVNPIHEGLWVRKREISGRVVKHNGVIGF